jgi:dolichyl-phosphate beta-glucosyltransferase
VRAPPSPDPIHLSVVIPAYNESLRLAGPLAETVAYLSRRQHPHEIIVVDDGSRDATPLLVETFAAQHPATRLVRLAGNHGKGYAVRAGVLESRGDLVLFADADGATPIWELERLEAALSSPADVVIASRPLATTGSGCIVHARRHRTILGNLFNSMVQRLGLHGIRDTQCGFKLFRGRVAHDLFRMATVAGYGFDLEILYLAQRRGYRIVEVPVNWSDQPGSKVRVFRDGFLMLRDLLAVRRREAAGLYRQPSSDAPAIPFPAQAFERSTAP